MMNYKMSKPNARTVRLAAVLSILFAVLMVGVSYASGPGEREHDGKYEHDEKHERKPKSESGGKDDYLRAENVSWRAECGECHLAYPPGMLAAEAWRDIMNNLDNHFGDDASLDAETVAEIQPFLEQYAAPERRLERDKAGKPVIRITETRWFRHEHDEISPLVWQRKSINSASNCAACHTRADQGDFDEDYVRIPR